MFDRMRDRMAVVLFSIANRITGDDRSPGGSRVSTSLRTLAGVLITPDTAITISAVWACLRYLSQTVAVLPWHVMRQTKDGVEVAPMHPVDYLLWKRPNKEWSSFQFRETLVHWALRYGNGYAEIEPDQADRPFALWPIHPERVQVCRAIDEETVAYGDVIAAGELYYEITNGTGAASSLAAKRMYHLRGFGEGPVGVNVIDYASQSLGWARAIQLFGASFFGNGMNPSVAIINKKPLKPDGLQRQKTAIDNLHKGPTNANKALVLDNDSTIQAISIDPSKSQLVEASYLLVEEVCRWFGVPPHKVMHLLRATFSNIEHQAIEVVVDSVTPWVKRFEDEADYKLFGAQNRLGFYTKMNLRALLRGDFKSQNEGLQIARLNGVINADEWREYMDLNKMPAGEGGDKYIMQSNNTTLERIGEEVIPPMPALPAPDPAPADDTAANAVIERISAMLESAHAG